MKRAIPIRFFDEISFKRRQASKFPNRIWRRFLHGIVGLALTMFLADSGSAQVPATPLQPIPTVVSGSVITQTVGGLSITVDSRWLDGSGYRPIRISVTPAANVLSDRDLLIRVTTERYYNFGDPLIVTEQYLSVPSVAPAGQAIKTSVSVPPSHLGTDFSIEIIDPSTPKGTVFKQQQIKGVTSRLGMNGLDVVLSKYPHILIVGNALPNTSAITAILPPLQGYPGVSYPAYQGNVPPAAVPQGATVMPDGTVVMPDDSIIPNNAENTPQDESPDASSPRNGATAGQNTAPKIPNIPLPSAIAVLPADLPERWIDYSSLDVVCLSIDQLADLAQKRPAAYRAILDWTRAGGNLWICGLSGTEGPWDRLPDLDKLLFSAAAGDMSESKVDESGWRRPADDDAILVPQSNDSNMNPSASAAATVAEADRPPEKNPAAKTASPRPVQPMLLSEYGMGTVTSIASANPFAGDAKWTVRDWARLLHEIGVGRWQWNIRHGMNVGQINNDFWNFLIPGVGLAPVRTFQVFITLFVLGIGPVNYWLLRRRKRLHLMVLTVPLSAGVVTGLLFGYALVADGLGVRVRARSVTRLDAQNGQAVTWTRLSYYAGIAPSKGLTFSSRTAVYPILDKEVLDYYNSVRKKMTWEDDQRLVNGWLDARTPTQYLTVRSGPSACRLNIDQSSDPNALPTIENHLGAAIDRLAICGRDGKYYYAENVGEGAKVHARKTTAKEIRSWLNKCRFDNQPVYPSGGDPRDWNRSSFTNRRSYYYSNFSNSDAVELAGSRLERTMDRLTGNDGQSTMAFSENMPLLAQGSYVALLSRMPDVELGTDSAREEASFHVIVGEW